MLKQAEGPNALAKAIALCKPQVMCAYPLTPQMHIVEDLGAMVKGGQLANCEFVDVDGPVKLARTTRRMSDVTEQS